jgi:hypothetical protein
MISRHTVYVIAIASVLVGVCAVSNLVSIYAADIHATITTGVFVPLKPLNLAVSIGDQSVDLSWSIPSSDGGSAITDYVIEYRLTSGGVWAVFSDGVSPTASTTVTGLTNDTSYDFRVSAVNIIGQGLPAISVSATPGVPAQILIMSVSDMSVPTIVGDIRITNEGVTAYEYQYSWCVTNSDANLCGGGDDVFNSMGAKLIQPGENWDTTLPATVELIGNYWFHVQVQFGSDTSYTYQSFTTVSAPSSGGGGSSGSRSRSGSCVGGDINRDKKVNLVDFSIFLMSFNQPAPFPNPCVDINRDGKVNVVDFSILLTQWGKKPVMYKKTL